jgi:hypothetical protein
LKQELGKTQPLLAHKVTQEIDRLEAVPLREWSTANAALWMWLWCVQSGAHKLNEVATVQSTFGGDEIDGQELSTFTQKTVRRLLLCITPEISERDHAASSIFERLCELRVADQVPAEQEAVTPAQTAMELLLTERLSQMEAQLAAEIAAREAAEAARQVSPAIGNIEEGVPREQQWLSYKQSLSRSQSQKYQKISWSSWPTLTSKGQTARGK